MQGTLSYTTASILLAISGGRQYGFDVMDCTGFPSGTVYPALRRLEQAGLVASEWERDAAPQRDQRPPRKYYSITSAGETALARALARYPLLSRPAQIHASQDTLRR